MTNKLFALMKISWENCSSEITKLSMLYLGMWITICIFFMFVIRNMVELTNQGWITSTAMPSLIGTSTGALYFAAYAGFINTIYFLTFLFIIICLFEYSANFIWVCYCYDEKNWETPKQISKFFVAINERITTYSKTLNEEDKEANAELEAKLVKIRNNKDL